MCTSGISPHSTCSTGNDKHNVCKSVPLISVKIPGDKICTSSTCWWNENRLSYWIIRLNLKCNIPQSQSNWKLCNHTNQRNIQYWAAQLKLVIKLNTSNDTSCWMAILVNFFVVVLVLSVLLNWTKCTDFIVWYFLFVVKMKGQCGFSPYWQVTCPICPSSFNWI